MTDVPQQDPHPAERHGTVTARRHSIPDIELANISRFRGELMGAAMIIIILFHIDLPRADAFFGLRRMGNLGVDMFLFLSGIGLWFAWSRRPDWRHFLRRRFVRIYPCWLIIACAYYIPRFHGGSTWAWIDLIGEIGFNWEFWIRDELTFWYVPAIMLLYLFAPPYMTLITRHPIYRWLPAAMIMWCILVQWVTPIHNAVGHLEIFWSRVPIFFIGINMGETVRQKKKVDGTGIWLVVILFVMSLASSIFLEQERHGEFPLFIERMLYIPLTVTTILLLNRVFRRLPPRVNRGFAFVGALSLECYLIHIHFVLDYLPHEWSYWPTFLACTALTLPAAWILSRGVKIISRPLERWSR